MPVPIFSHGAGTKGEGGGKEAPYTSCFLILSLFVTRSLSFYLRKCKMGWCRLMLRLGKGSLPSGKKRTPNRADLGTILCGFATKQESTSLSLKHLAMGRDKTVPPGQEYQTNLLWIILGICSKDGSSKDRSILLLSPGQKVVWDGSS